MIRRRSTLDHTQKIRKNKIVETLTVLDLCLQISADDRLIIRNKIKNGQQQLSARVYQCKKDKDYHALQIYLRKYLQTIKSTHRFGYSSYKTRQSSHGKIEKTPSVRRLKNVQTEASNHNSLKNSFPTSPKQNTKTQTKTQMTLGDLEQIKRKIQYQIDNEISNEIKYQQITNQPQRGVTPRDTEEEEKMVNGHRKQMNIFLPKTKSSYPNPVALDIKTVLKQKLKTQQNHHEMDTELSRNKKPQRENKLILHRNFDNRVSMLNQQNHSRYGEFYKRIKMTIENDM